MKTFITIAGLCLLGVTPVRAQWTVYDPAVHTQIILNGVQEIAKFVQVINNQVQQIQTLTAQVNEFKKYESVFGDPSKVVLVTAPPLIDDLRKTEVGKTLTALEGAAAGVKSNVIVPAAVTRMAEGIDTSAYPPMGAKLVAPVVGWLAHESCSVTGEMFIALAGRVARAVIAESPGVYRPSWTVEDVGEHLDAIRNIEAPLIFPVVPDGHNQHIRYSFELAHRSSDRGALHG